MLKINVHMKVFHAHSCISINVRLWNQARIMPPKCYCGLQKLKVSISSATKDFRNKELRQPGSIPYPSIESSQTPAQNKNKQVISICLNGHPITLSSIRSHREESAHPAVASSALMEQDCPTGASQDSPEMPKLPKMRIPSLAETFQYWKLRRN